MPELQARPRELGVRAAWLAAVAAAVLAAAALPPIGAWPLVWLWPVPLIAALRGRSAPARIALGAGTGIVFGVLGAAGPGTIATSAFLGWPLWKSSLGVAGAVVLLGGGGFAALGFLCGDPWGRDPLRGIVRFGLAVAAAEWLRSLLLPWQLVAYALAPVPALAQSAAWGGLPLLGVLIGATGAALAAVVEAIRGNRPRELARTGLAAVVLVGVWMLGWATMPTPATSVPPGATDSSRMPSLRVGLVQPGLPVREWSNPARAALTVEHLIDVSLAGLEQPVDLLIWPENAVQASLPANRALVQRALDALDGRMAALLIGAPRYDESDPTRRHNSALLYRGEATPAEIHDKVKLLPFFESVPDGLAWAFPNAPQLTAGVEPATFDIGEAVVGPLICFEALFPGIGRSQTQRGADLLVHLSNDAWFLQSGGGDQHLAAAVLLAISLRRPLLRATPSGITAAIGPGGRVRDRLERDVAGVLVVEARPQRESTGYALVGDALGPVALVCLVLWSAIEARGALRQSK